MRGRRGWMGLMVGICGFWLHGAKGMVVSHILKFEDGSRTAVDFYNPFLEEEG